MANTNHEILERNFILKRVGDDLYLPCEEAISCKVPPLFPTETYVMCRTYRFSEDSGRLFLAYPTGHERWSEYAYIESTRINSALIISSNVREFELIRPIIETPPPPRRYKTRYVEDPDEWKPTPTPNKIEAPNGELVPPAPPAPVRTLINENRQIPISDLTFESGKISFSQYINPLLGSVPFEINHPAIQKEWDAVKEYFEKVLRSKHVACHITLEALGADIQSRSAQFLTDDLLDGRLLDRVQDYVVQSELLDNGEDISIVEEILKPIIDSTNNDVIDLNWLLDKSAIFKKSKHYDHLRHLSSMQEAAAFRLRITGKPVSFIFVVKGALDYFLVWETYETEEATYIWKLDRHDKKVRTIEMEELLEKIKWLRAKNKLDYIRSNLANFKRIEHNYSEANYGFEKWKAVLTEHIT